ncbi:MAG: hypothetical protein WDO73_24100 [Ignavibacteriota bacterium]
MFVAGRSYQELLGRPKEYASIEEYFQRRLDAAGGDVDLGFMASHLDHALIGEMILEAHRRFWNVCGIFFANSISMNRADNAEISGLGWDERWLAENARSDDSGTQNRQLRQVGETIVQMIVERARSWKSFHETGLCCQRLSHTRGPSNLQLCNQQICALGCLPLETELNTLRQLRDLFAGKPSGSSGRMAYPPPSGWIVRQLRRRDGSVGP